MKRLLWVVCLFGVGGLVQLAATSARSLSAARLPRAQSAASTNTGAVRTYYVAAEEVEWDYAPLGMDMSTGKAQPFEGATVAYTQPGPNHIGHVYKKAIYREYTDATFTTRKPRAKEDEYMGLLGPVLRAEVGDTIKVVFKNNASHPYSMHPHGVFYKKDSEGALYDDATSDSDKVDDAVPPGKTHVYIWEVP